MLAGRVGRVVSFSPPPDAVQSPVSPPGRGWVAVGWEQLERWREKNGASYRDLGAKLGCAPGTIAAWKQGRPPSPIWLPRLEAVASVPAEAWSWWRRTEGGGELADDANPVQAPAVAPRVPPAVPPAQGARSQSVRDRLEGMAEDCQLALRLALGPSADAAARDQGKLARSLLQDLARVRAELRDGAITQHPEYPELIREIAEALRDLLGSAGGEDIELRLAEALEARAAANADRRAAA